MAEVTAASAQAFAADYVVLGGGNAKQVDPLPDRRPPRRQRRRLHRRVPALGGMVEPHDAAAVGRVAGGAVGDSKSEETMRYLALATDYDGTDRPRRGRGRRHARRPARALRDSGRKLILVTGRELDDLVRRVPRTPTCSTGSWPRTGPLLYHPDTQRLPQIAPTAAATFVAELRRRGVPLSVGRSIVATVEPHEHAVLAAIRDLGLEWHVIFNKGSVMALPSGVTKATGLAPALEELGLTPDRVVGVGDAENDHAFLRDCAGWRWRWPTPCRR